MDNAYKNIAIILPTWNNQEDIRDLLKSLRDLAYQKDKLEIIIVDNNSTDNTIEIIRDEFQYLQKNGWRKVLLIEQSTNIGIPEAYNLAYKYIGSDIDYILRTESDVVFDVNTLSKMVNVLNGEESVAMLGCEIKNYKSKQPETGAIFIKGLFAKQVVVFPVTEVYCDRVLGCCVLLRKTIIDKLEFFFDPDFFINGDEGEFADRIIKLGYKVLFTPSTFVFHKGGKSSSKISLVSRYYSVRNEIIGKKRNYNWFKFSIGYLYYLLWGIKCLFRGDRITIKAVMNALIFPVDINKRLPKHKQWINLE